MDPGIVVTNSIKKRIFKRFLQCQAVVPTLKATPTTLPGVSFIVQLVYNEKMLPLKRYPKSARSHLSNYIVRLSSLEITQVPTLRGVRAITTPIPMVPIITRMTTAPRTTIQDPLEPEARPTRHQPHPPPPPRRRRPRAAAPLAEDANHLIRIAFD